MDVSVSQLYVLDAHQTKSLLVNGPFDVASTTLRRAQGSQSVSMKSSDRTVVEQYIRLHEQNNECYEHFPTR
jgi:hypothetical protein